MIYSELYDVFLDYILSYSLLKMTLTENNFSFKNHDTLVCTYVRIIKRPLVLQLIINYAVHTEYL